MMRTLTTIGAGVATATALAVTASPASAATVTDERSQLRFPASAKNVPGPDSIKCIENELTIPRRGKYEITSFGQRITQNAGGDTEDFNRHSRVLPKPLRGKYKLSSCIFAAGKRGYTVQSKVINLATNGVAYAPDMTINKGTGLYHWGSSIQKVRRR